MIASASNNFCRYAQLERRCQSLRTSAGKSPTPGAGGSPSQTQPQKTSPLSSGAKGRPHPQQVSGREGKQRGFPSTETFVPLSEIRMSGRGMPVHVPPSRDAQTSRGSGTLKTRSRSISPSPSDLKKMKRKSISDKGKAIIP